MSDPDVLQCHPTHPAQGRPWWRVRLRRTDPLEPGAAARRLARRSAIVDVCQAVGAIALVLAAGMFLNDKAEDRARAERIEQRADRIVAVADAQSVTLEAQRVTLDAQARALEAFRQLVVATTPEERAAARAALEGAQIPEIPGASATTTTTSRPRSTATSTTSRSSTTSVATTTTTPAATTTTTSPPAPSSTTTTTTPPRTCTTRPVLGCLPTDP